MQLPEKYPRTHNQYEFDALGKHASRFGIIKLNHADLTMTMLDPT